MAHELGHYFMHEGLAGYTLAFALDYDEFENQANEFASGLLALFYVEEYDCLPNTIRELELTYGLPTNS